jgi:gliding motility-associated-like protein
MIDKRCYRIICSTIFLFLSLNFVNAQVFIEGSGNEFVYHMESEVERLFFPDVPEGCFQIEICGFDPGETYDLTTGLTYTDRQLEIRTAQSVQWSRKGRHLEIVPENSCIHFTFCFKKELPNQFPFISFSKQSIQKTESGILSRYDGIDAEGGISAEALIRDVLIGGNCFDVSNIQAIGPDQGRGRFFGGASSIGIEEGIVFSTGNIRNILGPNNRPNTGSNLDADGDPDLRQLVNDQAINDAVGIQFDFVPTADTVRFRYVFASEEYCEWVGDDFNDVFGFFISGPGINGPFSNGAENIALIPGTTNPVAINNVNRELNDQYYIDNTPQGQPQGAGNPTTCGNLLDQDGFAIELIEFDGYTAVFEATAVVIPCETYTIKMVIGDVIDANYDSAVFLEAGSFDAGASAQLGSNVDGVDGNIIFDDCMMGYFVLNRIGSSNISDSLVIRLNFSDMSTAEPGVDFIGLPETVVIPPFQDSIWIPIEILETFSGGPLRIVFELDFLCSCTQPFAEIIIDYDPELPKVSANVFGFISCDDPNVLIQGEIINPNLVTIFEWRDQNWDVVAVDELAVNVTQAGEYYFIGINEVSGCSDTVSVVVEVNQDIPGISIIDPELISCIVESVILDGSNSESGTDISYSWQAADGGMIIGSDDEVMAVAGSTGLYTLTVLDESNGCENSLSVRVEGDFEEPSAELNSPEELNCLVRQSEVIANPLEPDAELEFEWQAIIGNILSGSNSSTIMVDEPGIYELELTLIRTGCSIRLIAEVEENIELPLISAGENQLLPCDTPTVFLTASSSNHGDNYEISWSTSDGVISGAVDEYSLEVTSTGTYVVRLFNLDNGCEAEDFVEVGQNLPTDIDLEIVQPICPGDPGLLTVFSVEGGSFPYTYQLAEWGEGSANENGIFSPLTSGDYTLEITDALGCRIDRSFTIIQPYELVVSLPETDIAYLGRPFLMETELNVPDSDIDLVIWTPSTGFDCVDCLRPSVNVIEPTTYQIYVEDFRGCPATAEIKLDLISEASVFIPNAFSPNSDGINDILVIHTDRSISRVVEWSIYNRWGKKYYSRENFLPNDEEFGWDGKTVNGNKAEHGVYVFIAILELIDGEIIQISGDITVLK